MSGAICDKRVVARVKGNVEKRRVRAAMFFFGLEMVALKKRQEAVGGGRVKHVELLFGSDENGQD